MTKGTKWATGLRYIRDFDIDNDAEIHRIDVLLAKVLKDGPQELTLKPELQYHFSFDPERTTIKDIAEGIRSLADKIEGGGGKWLKSS